MKRADPWLIATIGFADRDAIHVLGYLKVRSVNKGARSNQSTSFSAASVAGSDPTSWTGFVSMTRLSVSHAHYRYEERETAAASHRERKTREGTSFGSGSFFTALADSSLYRSRGEATAIRGSSLQTLRRPITGATRELEHPAGCDVSAKQTCRRDVSGAVQMSQPATRITLAEATVFPPTDVSGTGGCLPCEKSDVTT